MKRHALGSLLIVVAAAACSSPKGIKRSTVAKNPAAGAFTDATLDFTYEPPYSTMTSAGGGLVTYRLALRGAAPVETLLELLYTGGAIGNLSGAETDAMKKGPERLQFAPDGHALAFGRAGEPKWRYIALDAGAAPLYCRHLTFGTAADPFAGAPSTHDLALSILKTENGSGHDPDPRVVSAERFERELTVAASYACAHRDDAALREAVASAIVLRGSRLFSTSIVDPIVECVGEIARTNVEPRNILTTAVGSQDPEMQSQVARAAVALAHGDDAGSAEAIASALRQPAAARDIPNDSMCWMRSSLTWSLAKITAARSAALASKGVIDALVEVALAPEPCKMPYGGIASRIYAVRALGVLSPSSVHAYRTLNELAKGPCEHPVDTFPTAFEKSNEGFTKTHEIACWAQAAVAHAAHDAGTK